MKVIDILNEFLDTKNFKKKDGRDSLEDFIWKNFDNGIGIFKDKLFEKNDAKVHIFWIYYGKEKPKVYYTKKDKTIYVKIGMDTLPQKGNSPNEYSEWDTRKYEPIFRNAIGPAINDYYNDN